jgi:predicted TIM-barrel fold metal-dependent hydrolase
MANMQADRRSVLGGISSLAIAGPALAADKPDFEVPDGACDCHLHLYDPRFPYMPNARLRPVNATVSDYRIQVERRLRTSRQVAVTPSTYGRDNRCLVDGLKQFNGTARGIAVVAPDVSDDELKALHAAGVRGVRVNYPKEQLIALAKRLHEVGWNMEFFTASNRLPDMEETLAALPTPVVLDHLAHIAEPEGLDSAGYKTVRRLLDRGNTWMKCSGAYIDSKQGPPDYADSSAVAKSYIAAAPERCLWATNWPFPDISAGANAVARPDALPFFDLFGRWTPDVKIRHRILVENPEALYGFDPADRPKPV